MPDSERELSGSGFDAGAESGTGVVHRHRAVWIGFVLGVAAVVWLPIPATTVESQPIGFVVGVVLLAFCAAVIVRRGLVASPEEGHDGPFATALSRIFTWLSTDGSSRERAWVAGASLLPLAAGALGSTAAKAWWGPAAIGVFATGFAGLGVLAGALLRWTLWTEGFSAPGGSRSVNRWFVLSLVLVVIETIRVAPRVIAGWRTLAPRRRVRFEIGGLGTRVEDVTPVELQDHGATSACLAFVLGIGVLFFGVDESTAALATFAILFAPALVSVASQIGGPLVAIAAWSAASIVPALMPIVAVAVVIALLYEAQRFCVLTRARPKTIEIAFLAGAALATIVRFVSGAELDAMSGLVADAPAFELGNWRFAALPGVVVALVVFFLHERFESDQFGPRSAWDLDDRYLPNRLLRYASAGAVMIATLLPWWASIPFVAGAFVGRVARGSAMQSRVPDLVAAPSAGVVVGAAAFAIGLGIAVALSR